MRLALPLVVAVVAGPAAGAGWAVAATGSGGVIHGCTAARSGALR
jgi:hypothetical protein